jgi:asparagine synthase (glutamine-hydrolysing)
MCGIFAHYLFDREAQLDESVLRSMADTMIHRGPDDSGYWVDGRIGLAHRRLSIIDLSPDGRQPMTNEDESVLLTFNGEIYNFAELRRELISKGHHFKSRSDSEVILHGYEEWGTEGCLERLRGMFAFVIWDRRREQLFAARDRLGIKPLYYRDDGESLILASEIKAILAHPEIAASVDARGLLEHFAYRFTLPPQTAFEGISKLPAGHYLVAKDGRVEVSEYWRVPDTNPEDGPKRSIEDWTEELRAKLLDTVEGHLISDVPVGAFLSGGLDSGSLVALAAGFSDQPVKTYTAGFGSGWHDESAEAREVATLHHTDHHETVTTPSSPDLLEKIVWHLDEPLINTSVIPLYSVAEMASRDVKVVLAGEGGDEVNGGYHRYGAIADLLRWRNMRHSIPGADGIANLVSNLLPTTLLTTRIKRLNRITHDRHGEYAAYSSTAFGAGVGGAGSRSLFSPDVLAGFPSDSDPLEQALLGGYENVKDPRQKYFIYDMRGWLSNELLIRADKITMAHSLEGRVPFLDHELVELCLNIPADLKLAGGETKAVMRRAMKSSIPKKTAGRKQHGFVVPIADWIRGDWSELVRDLASDPHTRSRGVFDPDRIDDLIDEHMRGKADWSTPIYGFLMGEMWHREFIDS